MILFSDLHKLQFFVQEISCTHNRFRCTFVRVGKRARKGADVHIENKNIVTQQNFKEGTHRKSTGFAIKPTLLIITWYYGGRNCTKLVLKLFAAKNGLFQSCVLLFCCQLYHFSLKDDCPPFLYTTRYIYIAALSLILEVV